MAANQRELSILVSAEDKASGKIASLGSKIGSSFAAIGIAAAASAAAIGAFAVTSVKAAIDAERSTRQLEHAILDISKGTQQQVEDIKDLTDALQKKTGLDGDALAMGAAQLATFGLQVDTVQALTKSVADLTINNAGLTASSDDYISSANLVQKALRGEFGQLEKMGIRFTETQQSIINFGTESEAAAAIIEGFNQNLRETSDTIDGSVESNLAVLKASFGEIQESVGGALLPVLNRLLNEVIIPMTPIIEQLVNGALAGLGKAFEWIKIKATELLAKLEETGIITAFQNAFNLLAAAFTESLWPAIQQVWVALQPWMPLFESIAKVVGVVVIGAVLLLIVTFATLIQIVGSVISKIAEFITKVTEDLQPTLNVMKEGIDNITNTVITMVDWFNRAIESIKKFLEQASRVSGAVTGGVLSIITGGNKSSSKRALGGPVTGGQSYLVGERGPELFTPIGGGSITPNNMLGGGGGVSVGVSINVGSVANEVDVRRMAQQVGDIILGKLQSNMGI